MSVSWRLVRMPQDREAVAGFLSENAWPFHSRTLSRADALTVPLAAESVESHWIVENDELVGLVRLLDLDDIPDGSPMFDLRLGEQHRGRGLGTATVRWLSRQLFERSPAPHRIEATTRADNVAMRAVLERCGYAQEGEFREAWANEDGSRSNAMAYGLLKSEWSASTTLPQT